jgi:hypothetical protein
MRAHRHIRARSATNAMSVSHNVHTIPTSLPPDCLELLRAPELPPALSRVLACASYSLDAATGVKTGALDLLQLCASGAAAPAPLLSLAGVGGAVFDARWLPGVWAASDGGVVAHLCAVTAAGCLEAHAVALRADGGGAVARQAASATLPLAGGAAALSLAFFPGSGGGGGEATLAVSRADGRISLCSAAAPSGGSRPAIGA